MCYCANWLLCELVTHAPTAAFVRSAESPKKVLKALSNCLLKDLLLSFSSVSSHSHLVMNLFRYSLFAPRPQKFTSLLRLQYSLMEKKKGGWKKEKVRRHVSNQRTAAMRECLARVSGNKTAEML
jgi:hypothetical protein